MAGQDGPSMKLQERMASAGNVKNATQTTNFVYIKIVFFVNINCSL